MEPNKYLDYFYLYINFRDYANVRFVLFEHKDRIE